MSRPPPSARRVALEALRRVIDEGAYSNRVVPSLLARSGLDGRDRRFAADLAYGALRARLPIDRAIELVAGRPVERITPGARHALRLGAYQLLWANVAPHAAVDATVALVNPRERGFVNAVLRRLAEASPDPPDGDDPEAVALRTGLAAWAVRELGRVLAADEVEAAARALAAPAPLTLRANRCRVEPAALEAAIAATGRAVEPGRLDPDCLRLAGGDPSELPGFRDGWFAVQDEASVVAVRLLAPAPGERVLDACAGPGGKAAFAACLVGPEGLVVAADVHPARAGLVRRSAQRLGERVAVLVQDARRPAVRGGFDRVLVDAPCTGIGSARRRPELLWRVEAGSASRLARLQVAIAASAAELLRPGGRLVYAVCTFPRAETDAACDALLRHRPDLVPLATPGPDATTARHRLWPHRHGTDAMFIATFERARPGATR
ncbi:MAG: putative Fmu protein [Actinomycetota bacterium]|jgi:16S rRNA (cytosine967-C5)-methyltransferase|nr:MAG: putative Fmu protein [Actinomycetota bacterium]